MNPFFGKTWSWWQGSASPFGRAGGCSISVDGRTQKSVTPAHVWFNSNATNAGGFSAVCMLTAQRLYLALAKRVPVRLVD